MSNLILTITQNSPLAYNEFTDFLRTNFAKTVQSIPGGFESLEFVFQLGVFLDFFNNQSIEFEIDLINYDPDGIQESVRIAFENFEKVIGHFS